MLRIHLLGHLRLFYHDQPLKFAALPKTLPLWGYLLLHRDKPIPRDSVAFTLWPDVSESEARANLRRHLHELRRVLPPAPENTPWILTHTNTLQWNPAAVYWLDVAEFDRLAASPADLQEAVLLYGGDLLQTVYEDWVFFERERLRNLLFVTLTQLMTQSQQTGDIPQAINYALQLLSYDPMREDVTRELMGLRYESGDRAGAIQEYQRFAERLQEELGVKPMQETRQLYERMVKNEPLERAAKTHPPEAAPQPAMSPLPHNLPAQLTTFVGREEELTAVKELVGGETAVRLLTLTGPGGTGKTRLAIESGAQLVKESAVSFPDGIFFVGLAAVSDPHFILPKIAETLKISEKTGQSLLQTVQTWLQEKNLLLILDNFEQLVEGAAIVTDLLTAAAGVRVIVTSRILLRVYGEQGYAVPPLPLPDLAHLPQTADLLRYAAIALFVERIRVIQPGFTLNEENGATVAEICLRLDGLPLALELAAARSKLFPLPALLGQLKNRLRFLVGQARNLPARQQTLRHTIDWSYNLLSAKEKQVFMTLSVFSGVFTLEAAVSLVTSQWATSQPAEDKQYQVLETLHSLVDQSMFRQLPPTETDPQPHFRLLLTIREYAQEKLAETEATDTVRQQHAQYYLAMAQQARKEWGGSNQGNWLGRIKTAEDNLRAALSWALQADQSEAAKLTGVQIALALRPFWHTVGRVSEAAGWYQQALRYQATYPPETQVNLLLATSWQAVLQGDYATATPWLQEALQLARPLNNVNLLSDCLAYLASTSFRQEDYETAVLYFEETVALDRQVEGDNVYNLSASLDNLAATYSQLKKYDKAMALWQEGLALVKASGYRLRESNILENLGVLAVTHGDYAQAGQMFRESLQIRHTLESRMGVWSCLWEMAHLAFVLGQYEPCITLYTLEEVLRQEMGLPLINRQKSSRDTDLATIEQVWGETAVATHVKQTRTLSLDEGVAYALKMKVA